MTAPTFTSASQVADAIRELRDHDNPDMTAAMQMRAANETMQAMVPLACLSPEGRNLMAALLAVEAKTYACVAWDEDASEAALAALEDAADYMLIAASDHHERTRRGF